MVLNITVFYLQRADVTWPCALEFLFVFFGMVAELHNTCDKPIELISPSSVTEVLELNDLIKGNTEHHESFNTQSQKKALEMFVCVTDAYGTVKYSNFGLECSNEFGKVDIMTSLQIKCPRINEKMLETKQDDETYNDATIKTFLNRHICFVTLTDSKIPVILKLQQAMDNERLLIWLFKKASITEVSEKGFEIDGDQQKQYKFTKFKFTLAVDRYGRLINAPDDLLKKLLGSNYLCKTRFLDELIEISDDLKQVMETYINRDGDFYGKFSASSLDLAVNESFSNISVIYCAKAKLKGVPVINVTINLFNYIYTNENEQVFPLQVKYTSENDDEENSVILGGESFPEFQGLKIIRKISESVHSSVYEAVQLFQMDRHVIIKVIHTNDHMNIPAEIKFYEFFIKEPNGCEFIERPFNVENVPRPTIFMNHSSNQVDLFEFIQSNTYLPDDSIKIIFRQVASAVGYLHGNGIVHRDIKVKNIFKEVKYNTSLG